MTGEWEGDYPNVRATLLRSTKIPGVPDTTTSLVIWLDGDRFRIRDESGRRFAEMLGDVTVPRGFGHMPRTLEDFMDATSAALRRADPVPTDLFGDRVTGFGSVREAGGEPWNIPASTLRPIAEQFLLAADLTSAEVADTGTLLGRTVQVYESDVEGQEDGLPYRTKVRRSVDAPFVLLREVSDSQHPQLSVQVEMVELALGSVTDADLRGSVRTG